MRDSRALSRLSQASCTSRPLTRASDKELEADKSKGAFAKIGKDGKVALDVSLQDCTLGPAVCMYIRIYAYV